MNIYMYIYMFLYIYTYIYIYIYTYNLGDKIYNPGHNIWELYNILGQV